MYRNIPESDSRESTGRLNVPMVSNTYLAKVLMCKGCHKRLFK